MPVNITEAFIIIGGITGILAATGAYSQDIPHEYFIIGGMTVPLLMLYIALTVRNKISQKILIPTLLVPALGFLGWGIAALLDKGKVQNDKAIMALGIISGVVWIVCGIMFGVLDAKVGAEASAKWRVEQSKKAQEFAKSGTDEPLQRSTVPVTIPPTQTGKDINMEMALRQLPTDDFESIDV
jgi:hypothetical protein